MIHHIKRATRHLIFWSLMLSALGLLAVRILLHVINDYKLELANQISQHVDAPVTIEHLKTHIHGFKPQLALEDIRILSPDTKDKNKPIIQLKELRLGLNLVDLVLNRDILSSSWITLVGAKLTVKKREDGSIVIAGLKAGDSQPLWLLQGRKYQVLQSTLIWQDEKKRGKALVFDDVNLMIQNEGEQHRVHVLMNLAKKQGELLKVVLNVQGNIFEPATIQATGFIEGKAINLPEWVTIDLPMTLDVKSGMSDFKLWGIWQQARLASLTGEVQTHHLKLTRQHKTDFISPQFSTLFFWQKQDDQWQLDVEQFLLETHNKKYPASAFTVSATSADDAQLHTVSLSSPKIDIQKFAHIARFFVPMINEYTESLEKAQVKGLLENFTLFANLDKQQLAINGEFSQLGFAALSGLPGVDNFSGRISGNEQDGRIQFITERAKVNYPSLFRRPLSVDSLQGSLHWLQTANNWVISSRLLKLNTPDINSKTRLQVTIPKTDQPLFMDLQTAFTAKDMSKAPAYYPTSIMSKTLVDWLDHAFIGGTITKGDFLLYGHPKDFPFEQGEGIFEVLFHAKQLELLYHADWPHLLELEGDVLFTKDLLHVDLTKGNSNKVIIKQAQVDIPSLSKGEMVLVDGEFSAALPDTLDFLQKTPLDLSIPTIANAISVQGDTQASLKLKIPMEDYIPAKVDGVAHLNNAKLNVKSLDLPVDNITGELKFTENGLFANTLKALTLNYPIRIAIDTDNKKTRIEVTGRTGISDIRKQFDLPVLALAEGISDYRVQLDLPFTNTIPTVNIHSMLAGINLTLPANLAKPKAEQRELAIQIDLVDKPLLPMHIGYDNKVKALLHFNTEKSLSESGYVLIGQGHLGKTPNKGLIFEINHEQLDLQSWLGAGLALSTSSELPTELPNLNQIIVRSPSALWNKTALGRFDLTLKAKNKQWLGVLDSQFAKGELQIPFELNADNRISLDMAELDLSLLKQFKQQQQQTSQTDSFDSMPLLSLNSKKTRWQTIELGQLNLITQPTTNGIRFDNASLNGKLQKLTASGDWQNGKTRIKGNIDMLRANELFKQFDISNDFSETSGNAQFDLFWQGAPQQFALEKLQGQLDIELKEGRILSIEPGFGRMLGVLAVGQWIKRLQLDFSDIYEEGLSYNSITGHFNLLNGVAHTNNLIVDAIPAKITITGETNLVKQSMNHTIKVVPKSADAVPIAGTIMGKVASLIGRSLTGKDQDGFFFGSEYTVKGDWDKVKITPRHDHDGVISKTWNGLTDFSWSEDKD